MKTGRCQSVKHAKSDPKFILYTRNLLNCLIQSFRLLLTYYNIINFVIIVFYEKSDVSLPVLIRFITTCNPICPEYLVRMSFVWLCAVFSVSIIMLGDMFHRDSCEAALKEKHSRDASKEEDDRDEATDSISEQLAALKLVFSKAAEDDVPIDVSF